jgi:hypothetical protein
MVRGRGIFMGCIEKQILLREDRIMGFYKLVYDFELKKVGCPIIQALYGCDATLLTDFGFSAEMWFIIPTESMKVIKGTKEEWTMAVSLTSTD